MTMVEERVHELVARYSSPRACAADLLCDDHEPDVVAFTLVDRDLTTSDVTFGELRGWSERVAAGLGALGVGPGDRVATLMGKSVDYLATVMAIWRLGAVHVPLFTAFASPAIEMRLAGSHATVVVTDTTQRPKLVGLEDVREGLRIVTRRVDAGSLTPGDIDLAEVAATAGTVNKGIQGGDGPLVQIYTSGTTGRPKGVVIPLAAMATWHLYLDYGLHVTEADVFWCAADPGWAYGLFTGVLATMAAGRRSILHEDKFAAETTWQILSDLKVTNFAAAPTVYRALRSSTGRQVHLVKASSAGEPLTPEVNEWARDALGIEVHDHYGQTEAGMVFCNHHHPELARPPKPGSMGLPSPGWRTAVLRTATDEPAAAGELGRVVIDSQASPVAWFNGYDDAPEATKAKFTQDARWYLTGDAGYVDDDGHYFFSSRDDDVIIMAGYRIGPFDVESIISTHPAVQECAVIAVPDALRGEVIEAYVALTEPVDDHAHLQSELQQRVRDNLASFAYPRRVHVVDELPKTPSGKIQRFVLRQQRREQVAGKTVVD